MRNARRLDRLLDWALERQWASHDTGPNRASADPEWGRLVEEFVALCDAVPQPPPVTFRPHPRLVLLYSRKHGETPAKCRESLWAYTAVLASPVGRRLQGRIGAVEARYPEEHDQRI